MYMYSYISYYLSIYYVGFFYILSLVKHSSSSGISSFLFLLLLRAFPIPRVVDRIEKTLKRDNLQSFEISKFFNIPQKFQKKSYLFFSWNLAFRFLHQQFSNKFIDILLRLSQKFKLTSRARKRGTMSDSYRCYRTPERWWTLPLIRLSVESRYERSYRIKVIMEGESKARSGHVACLSSSRRKDRVPTDSSLLLFDVRALLICLVKACPPSSCSLLILVISPPRDICIYRSTIERNKIKSKPFLRVSFLILINFEDKNFQRTVKINFEIF